MDYVLLAGALGIAVVVLMTAWGAIRSYQTTQRAKKDYHEALAQGALPASLHPVVNLDACIGSGSCVEVCPEKDVLGVIDGKARLVNPTSCIGHGECRLACPVNAITLVIGSEKRGVDIPQIKSNFETTASGIYIVGELGGMGLVYNAMTQATQCVQGIASERLPRLDGVHQLAIVGAGPAGLAASVTAKARGLDFVTLDQETLGGTILHYPRQKIVMTRPIELPGYGWLRLETISKESLLEKWEDIVERVGLDIKSETKVESIRREKQHFVLDTSKGTMAAQRIVLAMGRRGSPRKLGVPGEQLSKVTYRLIEPESYADKRCLVVGGGDSAVEAALALADAGSQVWLAHRRTVFDRIKSANRQRLEAAQAAQRVEVLLEAAVTTIHPRSVTLKVGGRTTVVDNDYVIVQVGGELPSKFLNSIGIDVKTYHGQSFAPANT